MNPSILVKVWRNIYLNQKQDSKEGIQLYKNTKGDKESFVAEMSELTEKITSCENYNEFISLLKEHETVTGEFIGIAPIQEQLFSDFDGAVKSLGAWGGDFIMASSDEDPSNYFKNKGFNTILKYGDLLF